MTTAAPAWSVLARSRAEIGALLDTHDDGLSFDELARYQGRFSAFCRDLFRLDLTPQQTEGADALESHRQVLIHGGNGVGKDTLSAAWSLYECYVMGGLVLLSGPTDRQVREVLMRREVGRLWRAAGGKLPGERYEMAIRIPGREEGGLLAFTASDPEKFVGHHSALGRVFVGLTEAQGIPSEIFEAAQRCQPTRLLCVCNPTTPTAAVYAFSRSSAWRSLRWSCLDHPNVVEGKVVVPGAVDRDWVNAMRREHGESSRFWTVSVLGIFPDEAQSPLFRAARWDDAVGRGVEVEAEIRAKNVPAVLGVDVSRGGEDSTAIAVRRGPLVWSLMRYKEPDTQVNAERIAHEVHRLLNEERIGVTEIVIDEVGDGGGVHDKLLRLIASDEFVWSELVRGDSYRPRMRTRRVKVRGFKASRSAPHTERFANLRAQSFHRVGVEFEEGRAAIRPLIDAALLRDLREELLVHERIHQADDRILMAPKDEIRKSLGRSPDLADAFSMSLLSDLESSRKRKRATFARPLQRGARAR